MSKYPRDCGRTRRQKSISEELERFDRVSAVSPSDSKCNRARLGVPVLDRVERKRAVDSLVLRIARLPEVPKKVLAMCYYEDLSLSEIAACLELTESRVRQIRTTAVALLRKHLSGSLE